METIPHVIHYCWFGHSPLPKLAVRCIESWRKFFPDYEIKQWDESNVDLISVPFVAESYQVRKYAFVSDYVRFWVLYHYGGVYFDTDVEVIRSFDDILDRGAFMGAESHRDGVLSDRVSRDLSQDIAPGLGMAVPPGHPFIKEMMDFYEGIHFLLPDGSYNMVVNGHYTTQRLRQYGYDPAGGCQQVKGIWLYPGEYFCPVYDKHRRLITTENTHSIHHFAGTWLSPYQRFKYWVARKLLPLWLTKIIFRLKRALGLTKPSDQ